MKRFSGAACVSCAALAAVCIIPACKSSQIFRAVFKNNPTSRHFLHVSPKTLFYFQTFCCAYSELALGPSSASKLRRRPSHHTDATIVIPPSSLLLSSLIFQVMEDAVQCSTNISGQVGSPSLQLKHTHFTQTHTKHITLCCLLSLSLFFYVLCSNIIIIILQFLS